MKLAPPRSLLFIRVARIINRSRLRLMMVLGSTRAPLLLLLPLSAFYFGSLFHSFYSAISRSPDLPVGRSRASRRTTRYSYTERLSPARRGISREGPPARSSITLPSLFSLPLSLAITFRPARAIPPSFASSCIVMSHLYHATSQISRR